MQHDTPDTWYMIHDARYMILRCTKTVCSPQRKYYEEVRPHMSSVIPNPCITCGDRTACTVDTCLRSIQPRVSRWHKAGGAVCISLRWRFVLQGRRWRKAGGVSRRRVVRSWRCGYSASISSVLRLAQQTLKHNAAPVWHATPGRGCRGKLQRVLLLSRHAWRAYFHPDRRHALRGGVPPGQRRLYIL
jgi:hypothetical protein